MQELVEPRRVVELSGDIMAELVRIVDPTVELQNAISHVAQKAVDEE